LKTSEKTYWIKVAFAVLAAAFCCYAQIYLNVDGTVIFMLGAAIYYGISEALSRIMKLESGHGLKVGIGAYIFVWIVVWTLLYTASMTLQV